jgi:hypothetical protein
VPNSQQLSSSRLIAASAADIFRVVASPQGHVSIDGSGMLIAPRAQRQLTAVGDTFVMDMDGPARGLPELGTYTVENTVTKLIDDAVVEWSVGPEGGAPFGHLYGFTLAPLSDDETEVTHYYDWSGVPAKYHDQVGFPVIKEEGLAKTLARLSDVVVRAD